MGSAVADVPAAKGLGGRSFRPGFQPEGMLGFRCLSTGDYGKRSRPNVKGGK